MSTYVGEIKVEHQVFDGWRWTFKPHDSPFTICGYGFTSEAEAREAGRQYVAAHMAAQIELEQGDERADR